jgi:hypothetical protein
MSFVASLGIGGAGVELGVADVLRRGLQRLVGAGVGREERELVLRVLERLVERPLGHAHVAQQLVGRRRVVDSRARRACACRPDGVVTDTELPTFRCFALGVALGDERAVGPELPERVLRAARPLEGVEARDRAGSTPVIVFSSPCTSA